MSGAARAIDVLSFERGPLVRAKTRLGGEDDERPEDRPEFVGERVDLLARERS